jgi:hypothetical protein
MYTQSTTAFCDTRRVRKLPTETAEAAVRTPEPESPETLVARWRRSADADHPAGPLFTGGPFAEADIVGAQLMDTQRPTACTFSNTHDCC